MVRVLRTNFEFFATLIRLLWGSMRFAELSDLSDRDLSLFYLPDKFDPRDFLLLWRLKKLGLDPRRLLLEGLFAFIEPVTAPSLRTRLTPELPEYPWAFL